MKKKLSIVLAITLTLILSLSTVAFAAGGQVAEKEVDVAQEAGQAWLDRIAALPGEPLEWIGAYLTAPQVYYDLEGQPNAYMFAMEKDGVVGHIIVGSSVYGYPVFQAGESAPPSIPSANEVKSIIKRDMGLDVESKVIPGLTRLLYLGFHNLYAVYEIDHQMVGVNLIFKRAALVSNMEAGMPSPEDYKAAKKATREAKPKLLGSSSFKTLRMSYYKRGNRNHCGPCSGVSIGAYYRNWGGYPNLPLSDNMYDDLNFTMGYPTFPAYYGPGFVEMTTWYDYNNFSYDRDWPATGETYWKVVDGIDNGWPTALMGPDFKYLPGNEPHWIAIRGYEYPYPGYENEHAIICTDSATCTSYLHLDWDNLSYGPCDIVLIMD